MTAGAGSGVGAAVQDRGGGRRLSADQERALLQIIRQDGTVRNRHSALSTLWQAHAGLVTMIANRYRRIGIDTDDLISAGQLGVHSAIVRFDPDRFPGRLSTYAVPWIRWYVQDHVSRNGLPVRLPGTTAHRQLARFATRLFADARRACERERVDPSVMELCARVGRRVGLSADEVVRSQRVCGTSPVSFDHDTAFDLGEGLTPDDDAIQRLDRKKLRQRVLALAETMLGQREREGFLARCMTGGAQISQLDVLATRFGVSRERIYQLESSARRKIIVALRQEGLGDLTDEMAPEAVAGARSAAPAAARLRSR
jgi:RNA polymerase sigma factor (sigma-70 family)